MTEVAQPNLFSHAPLMHDKVSSLGGLLLPSTDSQQPRRDEGFVGHSGDVGNIWEEEERDRELVGNDGNSYGIDSGLYEVPDNDPAGTAEQGSDMDRFVEDEFQFLDSDDDDEVASRGSATDVVAPVYETLIGQERAETSGQDLSPPSPHSSVRSIYAPSESVEEVLEEPVEFSRSSFPDEFLDENVVSAYDFVTPPVPLPPPLPPAGVLFAKSTSEQFEEDDQPETSHQTRHEPKTIIHGAGSVPGNARPKDIPRNEPKNELFTELQGILNRRLRMINEGIERNENPASAAADVHPLRPVPASLVHQKQSTSIPPEETAFNGDHHLTSFNQETPNQTHFYEEIGSVVPVGSNSHIEDSSVFTHKATNSHLLRDSVSASESGVYVLPDGDAVSELREDLSSRGEEFHYHDTTDLSSQAVHAPYQVEELDGEGGVTWDRQNQTEIEKKLDTPEDDGVRSLIAGVDRPVHEQLHPGSEAVVLHTLPSPPSVLLNVATTSSKPQLPSSPNHSGTSATVVNRADHVTHPRPLSSEVVHWWEATTTTSGDEWTPQMDLMDNEFDDDGDGFPQQAVLITGRKHHKRRPDPAPGAGRRQPQKRTPSKLYQKKQIGGPERLANPGVFSLARINRAVKRVFGSISTKPSTKQRAPISDSVFLQEEGWEIYPSRPYDQSGPGESVKVVGVEKRPAYAYNAITRQLVILPDHDRILVTDDGRRIRDHQPQQQADQRPNGRTSRPTSPGRNTTSREKPRFASKSKSSNPQPPNLNTKTVKSIHMHQGRPESLVAQNADDPEFWRRNSSPNFAGGPASAASSTDLSKRKTKTLSQILSFRKAPGKTTGNGKKSGTDERMIASDMDLVKRG